MSSDLSVLSPPDGAAAATADMDERDLAKSTIEVPSTPLPTDVIPASQDTILSTEVPGSPMDTDDSFRTDVADLPPVIPSSQTPPPSSQVEGHAAQHQQKLCAPQSNHNGLNGYTMSSQRSVILSPPAPAWPPATEAGGSPRRRPRSADPSLCRLRPIRLPALRPTIFA